MPPTDLVDQNEIARRMGVGPSAVRVWRHRGYLPEPAYQFSGRPLWRWATVRAWARRTGRGHYADEPTKAKGKG